MRNPTVEFVECIRARKNIELISVDDSQIRFSVKGYLDNWDEDQAEDVIRGDVYFNRYSSLGNCTTDDAERIIKHIFLDRDIKIRICSSWQVKIGENVHGVQGVQFGSAYNGYLPHPQIQRFADIGPYEHSLRRLLTDGNYGDVIETCFIANNSINILDFIVMHHFITSLFQDEAVCIELPDGTVTDWKGAIYYINKKEGENNEQTD